jgi:glucose-1-phosphate adenylyltransferase
VVLSGDHVYKMDYSKFLRYHEKCKAVATVGVVEVPKEQASAFGVIEVDDNWRITSFREKPLDPKPMPGKPDKVLANMGVYCFESQTLLSALCDDAGKQDTRHDFGHDILPSLIQGKELYAYPFAEKSRKKDHVYWRDIGTLDSYYQASMDLVSVAPQFNLYDTDWPVLTLHRQLPPAKTVFAQLEKPRGRVGMVLDSIMCGGVIVSGGKVVRSVLSPEVRVNSYAVVEKSVLMDNVDVGRGARVTGAIVDKNVQIPPGFVIGEEPDEDRRRFKVTDEGVVVIPRNTDLSR